MTTSLTLQRAIDLLIESTQEDLKKNYHQALELYEQCIGCFQQSLLQDDLSDRLRESIEFRVVLWCSNRAKRLNDYLNKIPQKTLEGGPVWEMPNCTLQLGIDMLTRATEEDMNKNYEVALKLYEAGLRYFQYSIKHEAQSDSAKEAIENRCVMYSNRAEKVRDYLNKTRENKLVETGKESSKNQFLVPDSVDVLSTLQKGIDLVTRAVEEDEKKNYVEALKLYEDGAECFLHCIKYDAKSDRAREAIRNKCDLYLDRAKLIKDYLNKTHGYKHLKAGEGSLIEIDGDSGDEVKVKSRFFKCFPCCC